ncbi:riboflavin biosynthesis protein RibD [Phenylobacterium sp.]|uniref:riboflavin biosynthesis protein RibD n=2 Tax=Phenylobacterium sp. TaxID=1871053 RepID=UPI00272FBCB4|nr:riboflavin biosynthesis protein RibD [Phenylobacterium sp.]MDP1619216.1 riboflavin biosynthesis protein RibD [Phenylobacterium sp.]
MRRAIALAHAQLGQTGENPAVGCVIVSAEGIVVGEGATAAGGRPHAEEIALEMAGAAARGAVAFVTLEPCGARSSGAVACADRLAGAGVARVNVACRDASPYADGRGLARLAQAGLLGEVGLLAEAAGALYADYRPPGLTR